MAQDYGILITTPGTDVAGAPANQISLNTSNPFIKIDTQNKAGFQTIQLLVTNDPPNPGAFPNLYTYTELYKFKHGYTYIPSLEALFYVQNFPPGLNGGQTYAQDNLFLGGKTADDSTNIYAEADATYVYIMCQKYKDDLNGQTNIITGTNIQITTHVFVEDIGV
jgi:hypothetical protein